MNAIGKSEIRIDAKDKVQGKARYAGDINFPNQLTAKVLFARRPHAIIKNIDLSAALALPGVIDILTAKDVPCNEYGFFPDQPVLCGPGSNMPEADHVRYIGDKVALVIAETKQIAQQALKLIRVTYQDLTIITNPLDAMQPNATLIHPKKETNIIAKQHLIQGDVEKAFQQSAAIVTSEYLTPHQEHAYLEPEAGIAYLDKQDRITVIAAGQWSFEERRQIAHSLIIDPEKVRIIQPAIGGAFGGREDISIQIILALAAQHLAQKGIRRHIKLVWSREESILGHHKRHPFLIRAKWAADNQGYLTAALIEAIADGGAYESSSGEVLKNALEYVTGPYIIPNVHITAISVYTNNMPTGAFRGFGSPQGSFAAELQIAKLAEKLGIDPVEIRLKNTPQEGQSLPIGSPIPPGVSIQQVITTCAEAIQQTPSFQPQPPHVIGEGFACAYKNIGYSYGFPEKCWAKIEIHGGATIEEVILHHIAADVGQGVHTILKQMTAEAVGVPISKVFLNVADTIGKQDSGSVSASRMTFMAGNAIIGAAQAALEKWNDEDRPAIAEFTYHAPPTTAQDPTTGQCTPNVTNGYVAEAVTLQLDPQTGKINILNIICADDVGKAINPQQVEAQIQGALVQATGHTLLENFIQENGIVKTPSFATYLIPTAMDIPENINTIIVEYPDPAGPWGARGVGEVPFCSLPAAIHIALKNATGIWFNQYPLTPEKVLDKLKSHKFHPQLQQE
jgi:CO/xanthine dehydrogenase Mo-binding subunit